IVAFHQADDRRAGNQLGIAGKAVNGLAQSGAAAHGVAHQMEGRRTDLPGDLETEVGVAGFLDGGAPQAADHFLPVTAVGIPEDARVHADLAENVLVGQAIGIQSTCDGENPARVSGVHAKPPHRTTGPSSGVNDFYICRRALSQRIRHKRTWLVKLPFVSGEDIYGMKSYPPDPKDKASPAEI